MATNTSAPLREGYEIRQLTVEHLEWVKAIVGHTMSFDSPIWSKRYPNDQAGRAYKMAEAIGPSSLSCIESGLSYGVFIRGWTPRYPDTKPGGELRWNTRDLAASREKLLEQMDFPLVSIAMSKDWASPKSTGSAEAQLSWADVVEGHALLADTLKARDQSGKVWSPPKDPKYLGKVLKRSGTHTRGDHISKGLAKALAHFVMRDAAAKGFQGILIHTGSVGVHGIWENPPAPFKAHVVSEYNTGNPPLAFENASVLCKRIWVELREEREGERE